jgi:hypothetical protein
METGKLSHNSVIGPSKIDQLEGSCEKLPKILKILLPVTMALGFFW